MISFIKKSLLAFPRLPIIVALSWLGSAHAFALTINEFSLIPSHTPQNIAAGSDGNLWIADGLVSKVTPTGSVTDYTPNVNTSWLTLGPDGNIWFSEYGSGVSYVGKVTPGGVMNQYSVAAGFISFGNLMTAGPDGNIYAFNGGVDKIFQINPSGSLTNQFATPTFNEGVQTLVAGPDGDIWYTTFNNHKIGKMTTSGSYTEYTVATTYGSHIVGMTAGPDGNLWFTVNDSQGAIGKITTAGTITLYPLPTSGEQPTDITAGADGNLYFTENAGNKIGKITTAGTITEYNVPTPSSGPDGITAGPSGNIWFTESLADKMGELVIPKAPVLTAKLTQVVSGAQTIVDVTSGVSGNPDPASITILSGPSHGTAVDPPGTITYKPDKGYIGTDSLTYRVCSLDDGALCSQSTLTFNVVAPGAPDTGYGPPPHSESWLPFVISIVLFSLAGITVRIKNRLS